MGPSLQHCEEDENPGRGFGHRMAEAFATKDPDIRMFVLLGCPPTPRPPRCRPLLLPLSGPALCLTQLVSPPSSPGGWAATHQQWVGVGVRDRWALRLGCAPPQSSSQGADRDQLPTSSAPGSSAEPKRQSEVSRTAVPSRKADLKCCLGRGGSVDTRSTDTSVGEPGWWA